MILCKSNVLIKPVIHVLGTYIDHTEVMTYKKIIYKKKKTKFKSEIENKVSNTPSYFTILLKSRQKLGS